jgi:hypothetical protein
MLARLAPSRSATLHFIIVTLPGLEGHISHRRFEPPLISPTHFDDKPSKQLDECCYYSKGIPLKLQLIQFEMNPAINPPDAVAHCACLRAARRR